MVSRVRSLSVAAAVGIGLIASLVFTAPAAGDASHQDRVPGIGSARSALRLDLQVGTTKPALAIDFGVLSNFGLPGTCLANHHPAVFLFSGCTGQYDDQYWYSRGSQIVNWYSDQCLAAHADGVVFTFDCAPMYADQMWRPYRGVSTMLENAHFPGRCLAAHSDGSVFLFECTMGYDDQHWI